VPPALITVFPDPIVFQIPDTIVRIGWYGLGYVVAVTVMLLVSQREVARRGIEPRHVWNALIIVAVCALIGARLYHVIDQWGACDGGPCYSQNLPAIVLPPYSGLALYGGFFGGLVGVAIYTRREHLPFLLSADALVPGALFAQGIARWGNFFNQELYGPPTSAPWGITIGCDHRVEPWNCAAYPEATTGFHPLFFYESALDILGGFVGLFISRRYLDRLLPGDMLCFWFIWYGTVRFLLETFRYDYDWKLLGIAPTAMTIGFLAAVGGALIVIWRHTRGRPATSPPTDTLPPREDGPSADLLSPAVAASE
jgi:phosphatidylglycerol:prolipoprotein diacylglycerol transferase